MGNQGQNRLLLWMSSAYPLLGLHCLVLVCQGPRRATVNSTTQVVVVATRDTKTKWDVCLHFQNPILMEAEGNEERPRQFYGASACLNSVHSSSWGLAHSWLQINIYWTRGLISSVQNRKCEFRAGQGKGDCVGENICFHSSFPGDFPPARLKSSSSLSLFPNSIKQVGDQAFENKLTEPDTW